MLKREHDITVKENIDLKEQVRVLNENLRRETEVLLSRDRENSTLIHENKVLKEMFEEIKS